MNETVPENGPDDSRGRRKAKGRSRTAARLLAVQALYQIEISDQPARRVIEEFLAHRMDPSNGPAPDPESEEGVEDMGFGTPDEGHFRRVVDAACADREAVDGLLTAALPAEWPLARLDSTLRAVLRAGASELLSHGDVPAAVVISEYVDVSHAFHGDREPAFVNGLLDTIARRVREDELGAARADRR